jgi:hypothetical protein
MTSESWRKDGSSILEQRVVWFEPARFVFEHDRNVVTNRIRQPIGATNQDLLAS